MSGPADHLAEDVLPGHPDRLADALAERVVAEAAAVDPRALVAVEVSVFRLRVFVTGHVAAGGRPGCGRPFSPLPLAAWAAQTYREAGCTGRWEMRPEVVAEVVVGPLGDEDAEVRGLSDDQSIVVGHAVGSPATGYLPPGPFVARRLRRALEGLRSRHPEELGPDGKVLVHLAAPDGPGPLEWRSCNVAVQHSPNVGTEALHRLVVPALQAEADGLEEVLPGAGRTFAPEVVRLNGFGAFVWGGPWGDNGLSGKKLVVDHYGPGVPVGGGALCGKDVHRADRVGALAAREVAVRIVRDTPAREATVWLGWLTGRPAPDVVTAVVDGERWDTGRLAAEGVLPDLSIEATVQRLELQSLPWEEVVAKGWFGNGWAWER